MTVTTIPPGALTITRRQAHVADACVDDTRRVLDHIRERDGRIPRKDQLISLQDVADVLGVDGVIWCLMALGEDRLLRMFAVRCARRALRTADVRDPRLWRAVRVAQWHAQGWATEEELSAAARATAYAATSAYDATAQAAAWYAARYAAWGEAQGVSLAAARAAAYAATSAWGAERDSAWGAAWGAAWDAERDAQPNLLLSMAGYGGEA